MASAILPLAEIPTLSLLYRLRHLTAAATPQVSTPSQRLNDIISHVTHDITRLEVDCIVNAANESLLGGGGVDGAIHRVAGPNLLRECRTLDGCQTGDAKITDAYELPCKKVVHAVGPVYVMERFRGGPGRGDVRRPEMLLRGCYQRSLELSVANGVKSIAFSSISTGVYGYPSVEAATVAIKVVREFLESHPESLERVIFCTFERKDCRAYDMLLPQYFPPTEQDLPPSTTTKAEETETGAGVPHTPEILAASLPDAPTSEPVTQGSGSTAKKTKLAQDNSTITARDLEDDDDWEKVDQPVNTKENLDDDPVEVDNGPTAADVQSVSSAADLESSHEGKFR
ncbi:hypothetical protein TRV_05150 [Trichophyton verrucosum HKI 0517]|uniref:Macro domain-containing protein n=1 Tax=Trichophyton verrucosum (strain HKI 0517) TaxID=663202 RepID=D4DDE0_TRIVH|nr:uncharacterized protein TRV_05150 [Trichophyton verrucosum HKI 0517]EFE40148.1 hypothetical protein TRV_05150 [Trichophyton verrucosum HKI 0517]